MPAIDAGNHDRNVVTRPPLIVVLSAKCPDCEFVGSGWELGNLRMAFPFRASVDEVQHLHDYTCPKCSGQMTCELAPDDDALPTFDPDHNSVITEIEAGL